MCAVKCRVSECSVLEMLCKTQCERHAGLSCPGLDTEVHVRRLMGIDDSSESLLLFIYFYKNQRLS